MMNRPKKALEKRYMRSNMYRVYREVHDGLWCLQKLKQPRPVK